jgi:WD40 repeat protein
MVSVITFCNDNAKLITGGFDNHTFVYDLTNKGKLLFNLTNHTSFITSLALSKDDLTLYTGSDDKDIKVWSLVDGSL